MNLGSKVATIICDGAYRYQSRLFSKKWLASKGLEEIIPQHLKKYAVLDWCTIDINDVYSGHHVQQELQGKAKEKAMDMQHKLVNGGRW